MRMAQELEVGDGGRAAPRIIHDVVELNALGRGADATVCEGPLAAPAVALPYDAPHVRRRILPLPVRLGHRLAGLTWLLREADATFTLLHHAPHRLFEQLDVQRARHR